MEYIKKEIAEKKFVDAIKAVGIEKHYEMEEKGKNCHQFNLKNGTIRYWTDMSEGNLIKLGLRESESK